MKRLFAARATSKPFVLDRERFARFGRKFDDLLGIDSGCEGARIAQALEYRFLDAREAGAIVGPPGVEVIVYGLNDSMIVAVREVDLPRNLPVALRATYAFETKYVVNYEDESFEEACAAIEELLVKANALLPSFDALCRGERVFADRGIRRLLGRLRSFVVEPCDRAARAFAAWDGPGLMRSLRPSLARDADGAEEAIAEMFCDWRHLVDEHGLDWGQFGKRAERYYADEEMRHVIEVTTEGFQIRDTRTEAQRADVWGSRAEAEAACDELNRTAMAEVIEGARSGRPVAPGGWSS